MFRVPQIEISELGELILKDSDQKARFEAALHDKELPHNVWSVGQPTRDGQTVDDKVREKNAWQRVQRLKAQRSNKNGRF